MAHSIGKTIAELRKEKGWTQVELAEKLQVSDKAVSKWEKDDSFPSIEFFPILAQLFGVSIDYLMTGKKDEPSISLDDMDSKKRMLYIIKQDDVEDYLKYGYEKETYFDDIPRGSRNDIKTPIIAILENNSFKIFNACVRAGVKVKSYTRNSLVDVLYACVGHFDMLVRFACLAGCVDFLEQIQFKTFAVGDKALNNIRTNATYSHTYEAQTAYLISERTIDTIFNNENVPQSIIDYISTYVPFDSKKVKYGTSVADYGRLDGQFYFMEQVIIKQLYRTGRYDLLNKYLQSVAEDSFKTIDLFNNLDRRGEGHYVNYSITPSSYLIRTDRGSYGYTTVKGKVIAISSDIIHLAISNSDKEYIALFVNYNKSIADKISIITPYTPSESEIERFFENEQRRKRILSIQSDTSISDHERRCRLAKEGALSLRDALVADDYDAFVLLPESERNKIATVYLSRMNVQDIRFYIYAVNIVEKAEYLNEELKTILENYPERYDIQDVLLSAGAIIDGNIAMTNILKQNVLILNKQANADNGDVEVNESVSKQQLLEKIETNQLQYVIVNATIQMEKKLKVHIVEQGVDLAVMIDKALSMGLIDEFTCKLLHKLRMARNGIMHAGNKYHYTAEIVKMWVEVVYSIK